MKQKLYHQEQDGKCVFCGIELKKGMIFDECTWRYSLPVIEIQEHKRGTFPSRCKHFQLMGDHDVCKAGVKYDDVNVQHDVIQYRSRGTVYTAARSIPCFTSSNYRPDLCKCDKAQFPTEAEIELHYAEMDASMQRIGAARKAIVDHLGGPFKKGAGSSQGVIECPNCKGKLHFSRSGYNGHVHAECETKGCVSWME